MSGLFCCCADARQKGLLAPGPLTARPAGCPPRCSLPRLGTNGWDTRENGLNREVSGEEFAPSCCGGGSVCWAPPCVAQCKQLLVGLLRVHSLRTAPARSRSTSAGHTGPLRQPCLPLRRCQGRWEGTHSPRPPAPTGTSFQRRQLQPFPAEGADGRRDRGVSPCFRLCRGGGSFSGGWCLGCWWEWGTLAGNSSGAPVGHTGTSCRSPTRMRVHSGTSFSAMHTEGQSWWQGQQPKSGVQEQPGCMRRGRQLAARL